MFEQYERGTCSASRRCSDLDKWFDHGIDTPGIVLIKVKAGRITYWKGREEGEVAI